jgi:FkbM family methyltransferase
MLFEKNHLFKKVLYRNLLNKTSPLIYHFASNGGNKVCLDVGCSIGEYTLQYAQLFEQVHSFDPINLIQFNEHIDWSRVTYYEVALSSNKNTQLFYEFEPCKSISCFDLKEIKKQAIDLRIHYDEDKINKKWIEVITIDSFQFPTVDFIKIDVESNVFQVLLGGLNTISKFRPTIQLEVSSKLPEDISNFFHCHDYSLLKNNEFIFNTESKQIELLKVDAVFLPNERFKCLLI